MRPVTCNVTDAHKFVSLSFYLLFTRAGGREYVIEMNRNGERSYSIFDSLGPLSPFEKLHIE
jgi:hypothetical protein